MCSLIALAFAGAFFWMRLMRIKKSEHFYADEFACNCGCGFNNIDSVLVTMLEFARVEAGTPFTITSGCRCFKHNRAVGGVDSSSHVAGLAVDISVESSRARSLVLKGLVSAGFTRIGIHKKFIHVDIDPGKPESVCWMY